MGLVFRTHSSSNKKIPFYILLDIYIIGEFLEQQCVQRVRLWVMVMVFNATFNTISVIW